MDRRGNTIRYDYANSTNGAKDSTTRELFISKIRYTGFVDANGVSEADTKKLASFLNFGLVVPGGRFS